MGQTIEEVGTSWKNYSKEQQVAIAGIMGGQRQVNQIRALFDNWDKYTQTMKIAAEAEGTLQEEQDIFMESSEGQLQKLRTNWEGVLDSILSSEDIIKVAKSLQPVLESIEKIIDAFGGGIGILNGFLPILYQLVAPQISAGIAKIGMSFDASRNNAELARNEIEGLRTLLDNNFNAPGLESYQQQLNALIEDYARLRDTMTISQRNEFRESLKSIIAHEGPEVIKILNEINKQKNELSQKDTNLLDSSNLATLLNNNDSIGLNSTRQEILEISETLNNFIQNGVKPTEQEFDELAERLRNTFGESDTVENFVQDWENSLKLLKSGVQDFRRDFATQLMSEDGFDTSFLDNLRAKFAEVFGEGSEEIERLDLLISQIGNNQDIKNELEQTDVRLSQIGEEINNIINQRRAATREAKAAVQEQINSIESELRAAEQNFNSYQEAYPGETDVDNDILEEASDRLRAAQAEAGKLEELYKDLNELNTKLEEAEGSFQHRESVIKYTGVDYEGLVSQQNELRRESADIIRQQSELNTVLEGSEQEIADLAVTTDEAMNAEQNFNNVTGQMVGNLDAVVEDTAEVSESLQTFGNTGYETAQSINNINLSFREFDAQRLAQGITAIGQGFTTVVTGITQLKNLGQIWNDDDLELGEKLLRTLTSLGMVLTTSAMAINLFRNEQTRLAIAEIASTAADNIKILATRLYTEALNDAIRATLTLKAVTAITFAVVAAIIAAVVVAVYAFVKATETSEKRLEKANKKLEEATNKYNELKRALKDYAQAEEGLVKLEKGTKEFTDAISDLNQKVLDLIATYPELRKYLTIGDSGEFKLSKEGLEEYVKLQEEQLKIQQREVLGAGVITKGDKWKYRKTVDKAYGGIATQFGDNEFYAQAIKKGFTNSFNKKLEKDIKQVNIIYDEWLKQSQEADKKILTGYLKTYEQFAETSASITAAVVEDVYSRNKQNGEKAKKELDNIVKIQEEAKKYEKRAKEWENKGFNFSDADIKVGNFANLSLTDINDIFNMDRVELADLIGVDASDTDAINDFLFKVTKAYTEIKDLPSAFQTSEWQSIDLGIRQKFENIAGTIDDSFVNQLAIGLNNLKESTKINIDEFTTDLANIDWTQGATELEEFREKYGELNTELENYIAEQIRYNMVVKSSTVVIQDLADAMGKISTMKFGDTLSEKDYGELINKFKGLEKYFVKIGDKYTYMAKSNNQVTNEIKKSFDEQMNKMNQYSEKVKETGIRVEGLQDALKGINKMSDQFNDSNYQINATNQSIKENEDLKNIILEQTQMATGELEDLLSTKAQDLTDDQIKQLDIVYETLNKIQNWSISSANSLGLQKQYIAAVITSEKELNEAVEKGKISVQAAIEMRIYVKEKELEITEKLIEKENELKRIKIKGERATVQQKIADQEEIMNTAIGEEYNNALKERNKLREEDKELLKDEIEIQNQELNRLKDRKVIEEKLRNMSFNSDAIDNSSQAAQHYSIDAYNAMIYSIANTISHGEELTEEALERWGISAQEYEEDILPIIQDIANKTNEIDESNRELDNLYKSQKASVQEILEATKKQTNEIALQQKKRQMTKIDNRLAHTTGTEYLSLSEQKSQLKTEYSGLLQEQLGWSQQEVEARRQMVQDIGDAVALDAAGNVIIKNNAEITKEQLNIIQQYNNARKDSLELEYEIEDLYEKQYVTIDRLANTNAQRTKDERELAKLQREEKGLSGKELLENRKKQREIEAKILEDKKEAVKIQKESVEDSKNALEEALLKIDVKLDYDETVGILNKTDILEKLNGNYDEQTIEAITHLMDELDDNTDQLYDLQEQIAEAEQVIAAASDVDENTKIKSEEDKIKQYKREQKQYAEGSAGWFDLQKKISESEAEITNQLESKVLDSAKKDFGIDIKDNKYELGTYNNEYKKYIESKLKVEGVKFDDFGRIINREELIVNGADADAIDEINAAIDTYMDKVNALEDAQSNLIANNPYQDYEISIKKVEKAEQDLQKEQQGLSAELQKTNTAMSQLQSDASFLYGDDLVSNLEAQIDCLKQQQEISKQQVEIDRESEQIAKNKLKAAEEAKRLAEENLKNAQDNLKIDNIEDYIDSETGILDINKLNAEGIKYNPQDIEEYNKALEKRNNLEKEYNTAEKAVQDAENKTLQDLANENKLTNEILNKRKEIAQAKLKTAEEAIKRETNAQHALNKALKDTDKAIKDIQKDQNGLTGKALIQKLKEEIVLQNKKKQLLEQQAQQIKAQIDALTALYSLHLATEYGINVNFSVDDTGVSNPDQIYAAVEKMTDSKLKGAAMQDVNNFISSLNSVAGTYTSISNSVDNLTDSIEDLNKKIKETEEAEAFRIKEENWFAEEQAIKKVERALAKLQREQKHLTGPALIKNLEQQQKLLEKQAEAQARKLSLMKNELQTMQAMLALQGVLFSSDGLIANYAEIASQGNEKLTSYLQSYQSLYDQIMDLEEGIQETFDKKLDLEYEKAAERLRMFNSKIDVELDLGKAKREWQNFKREFLNTLNGMQQLNDSLAEKAKQNLKDIMDISARETPMLTNHVNQIMDEIHIMQGGGWSNLYGKDQATALSDLANYRQQLQDSLSAVAEKIKEIEESYIQQIQKIKGKFDDQLSNYEQIQSIIEHDMNLIKLLKGNESYEQLANYYDKSTKNYENEIGMLRNQVDYWKRLMDSAQPGTDEWEEFQKNWKDALSKLNSAVDAAIQNLMDKYENLINKILSELEKKITGGTKLDYIKQQWDWANEEADLYLDKISKEYNIQKLAYKYQKAANDVMDPNQRAKILKIMDEEIEKLKQKDKLTKYDVERANKIYDLKIKQMQLEDESQNKTKMRLRRDTEGNYRYEYVADEDKIGELKQEILDMEEEIRQFDLSALREKKEEAIKILQDFNDQARELTLARLKGDITEEEYNERIEALKQHYITMYDASAEAIDNISKNLRESTTDEMLSLEMMTKEELDAMTKEALDTMIVDISPIFRDTINEMIERIAGSGGFSDMVSQAIKELSELFIDFEDELHQIELAAGISFESIIDGIDNTIDGMKALIEDNDELLEQYKQELELIAELIDELHDLEEAYRQVYEAAMAAVDAALELRQTYLDDSNSDDIDVGSSESLGNTISEVKKPGTVLKEPVQPPKSSTSKAKKEDNNTYVLFWEDGKYKIGLDNNGDLADKVGMVANIKGAKTGKSHYQVAIDGRGTKEDMLELKKQLEEEEKKSQSFATGGYTGEWGSEGKIAMLHEKELVLNKDDTANILQAVKQTRNGQSAIIDSSLLSVISQMNDTIYGIYSLLLNKTASDLISAVTAPNIVNSEANNSVTNNINANFPNAGNMNEIKNAIMSLQNYASQQAHMNTRMNSATTANAIRK